MYAESKKLKDPVPTYTDARSDATTTNSYFNQSRKKGINERRRGRGRTEEKRREGAERTKGYNKKEFDATTGWVVVRASLGRGVGPRLWFIRKHSVPYSQSGGVIDLSICVRINKRGEERGEYRGARRESVVLETDTLWTRYNFSLYANVLSAAVLATV